MSASNNAMSDDFANTLAICLAHFAETFPPLIVANCVFGTGENGPECVFSVSVPSVETVAEWAGPQTEMVELIADCKDQGLTPSGAIRFLIPGSVIERCGIRDAVGTCMQTLTAAAEGKTVPSDEVDGLPMFHCVVVEASLQGDHEDAMSALLRQLHLWDHQHGVGE